MRLRNVVLVLLALAAGPAACSAGPIAFGYTTTHTVDPSSTAFSPGEVAFNFDQGTASQLWDGTGSVELGSVQLGRSPGPQGTDTYTAYTNFAVSVVVTDPAGRSATLSLYGGAVDDWTYRSWDGRWMNDWHWLTFSDSLAANFNSTTTILDGTRYTLAVRPDADNQIGVYTLTAAAATPEPATFALAALGLAPLALRLRRRNAT